MPRVAWIRFVLVVVATLSGSWCTGRGDLPPAIESLGQMDPDVSALLREQRKAIEQEPSSADAWGRFAMACEANGFVGAARSAYRRAVQLAPGEPRWPYRLALVTSRLGDHDEALAALTRTNDLAPQYGPAWARRGVWLLDRGDAGGAEAAFTRALAIDSGDVVATTGLARLHLQRRDNQRAADVLERLLERHPGDRYALQLLGTAYRRLGRMDDASFALAVGAGGEPTVHDPWSEEVGTYRRGFATMLKTATAEAMAGRFDRALPLLEQLRTRNPDDVSLTNHTAEVMTAGGRPADAIKLLSSVVDARTDNADTHLGLASAYLASGDVARAEAHSDRAIALHAAGARALELKGLIAWRNKRTQEATTLFEEGLARDPRNVRLLAWIGLIDLEAQRPRDALPAFSEVLRRDPLQPDALAGLALAQHALGREHEAALALARAEQVAPDHPRVREARARLQPSLAPDAQR
jgi:tetratricopeptide (TPR) repeat protein